jgi:DNA repair protein RecN (Recombination protein N)
MPGAKFDDELKKVSSQLEAIELSFLGPEAEQRWVDISEDLIELSELGYERATFYLASNPGEAALPLQKVASGGEISRIMLALKKALVAGANTCILVFDEIDSGISGRVATMVGKKMQDLAADFQIVCISHLPQVASFADTHLLVHKFGNKDRTESTISVLSSEQSTREIARLLSGDQVDDLSLANAESLQAKAKRKDISLEK